MHCTIYRGTTFLNTAHDRCYNTRSIEERKHSNFLNPFHYERQVGIFAHFIASCRKDTDLKSSNFTVFCDSWYWKVTSIEVNYWVWGSQSQTTHQLCNHILCTLSLYVLFRILISHLQQFHFSKQLHCQSKPRWLVRHLLQHNSDITCSMAWHHEIYWKISSDSACLECFKT